MAKRYQRIADRMREQINDGTFSPGDRLPTEPELADEYGMSRMTVRQGLDLLLAEGLIERQHGRGSYVRRPCERIKYVSACSEPEHPQPEVFGAETYIRPGFVTADASLSAFMGVELGTELAEYRYFCRQAKSPYCLADVYVPRDLAALLDAPSAKSPWGNEIALSLEAAGIGLLRVTERIRTRPPTQDEADQLHLTSGATVLEIERTSADDRGRIAVGARLVVPGDRVEVVCTRSVASQSRGGAST